MPGRDLKTVEMVRAECARRELRVLRVDLFGGCWVSAYQALGVLLERHPTSGTAAQHPGSYPLAPAEEDFEVWTPAWAVVLADCVVQDPREGVLAELLRRVVGSAELRDALLSAEDLGGMDAAHALVFELLGGEAAALRALGFREDAA